MNSAFPGARQRPQWPGILLVTLFLPLAVSLAQAAEFRAFPLAHYRDGATTDAFSLWAPWPFLSAENTTATLTWGLHPLFSWHWDRDSGESAFHLVWPFVRRTYRPSAPNGDDYRLFYFLPLLFWGQGHVGERVVYTRYLLPVFYQGRGSPGGEHFILFPFLWYARDARLIWPLFPKRPQTFVAFWPLFGDFRGYWNRDRILFLFWPLLVKSRKGRGAEAVYTESFLWPVFSRYRGGGVSGVRAWPLMSYVRKPGRFVRSYWLWPLGHYRTGLAPDGKSTQTLALFLPVYGQMETATLKYRVIFPFYGRVETGKRSSTGYLLAIYNVERNERAGTVERRFLWFVYRHKKRIPPSAESPAPPEAGPAAVRAGDSESTAALAARAKDSPETGWAIFPFYGAMEGPRKRSGFVLWPFYQSRWDKAKEFEFKRRYLIPFYSRRERRWNDGTVIRSEFLLPFFRSGLRRNGSQESRWLHLWWYDRVDGMDRNYAPLWTFYERTFDAATGERRTRVLQRLFEREAGLEGWKRTEYNFLVVAGKSTPSEREFSLLGGFFGLQRGAQGQRQARLLWLIKF